MRRIFRFKSILVLVFVGLLIGLGCSDQPDLLSPAADGGGVAQGDRSLPSFSDYMQGSFNSNYTTITAGINGQSGGTVAGTAPNYSDTMSIVVPPNAYSGRVNLSIKVPQQYPPVYQLLPDGSFNGEVTVTLDYYKWIAIGTFAQGDTLELYYMNEETEEFESLDPPAVFVADSTNATITFATNHFSRWTIGGDGN